MRDFFLVHIKLQSVSFTGVTTVSSQFKSTLFMERVCTNKSVLFVLQELEQTKITVSTKSASRTRWESPHLFIRESHCENRSDSVTLFL